MCCHTTPYHLGYLLFGNERVGEYNRNSKFHSRYILSHILSIFFMPGSDVEDLGNLNSTSCISFGSLFGSNGYRYVKVYV